MKQDIFIQHIETIAPLKGACSWDCSGLQVSSTRDVIRTCVVALDLTIDVITYALSINADIIITHHPLSLSPLKLHKECSYSPLIRMLYQHNIALYSAHTSLDATTYSIAGFLANLLSLEDIKPIETTRSEYIHSIVIYSPIDRASFESSIRAQDIEYLSYHQGDSSSIIFIDECYLTPMKEFLHTHNIFYSHSSTEHISRHFGIGCIGTCRTPLLFDELCSILKKECNITHARLHGYPPHELYRIAYCPGAGSSLISKLHASSTPVDIYITGEIKHHDAVYSHIPLLDVGHFALEETMMKYFSQALQELCRDVLVKMYSNTEPLAYIAL